MKTLLILLLSSSLLKAEAPKTLEFDKFRNGVESAVADLKKGEIKYNLYVQPSIIDEKLATEANKKYNIKLIQNGCIIRPESHDFNLGYHHTVLAYLEKHHGKDPIVELSKKLLNDLLKKKK